MYESLDWNSPIMHGGIICRILNGGILTSIWLSEPYFLRGVQGFLTCKSTESVNEHTANNLQNITLTTALKTSVSNKVVEYILSSICTSTEFHSQAAAALFQQKSTLTQAELIQYSKEVNPLPHIPDANVMVEDQLQSTADNSLVIFEDDKEGEFPS